MLPETEAPLIYLALYFVSLIVIIGLLSALSYLIFESFRKRLGKKAMMLAVLPFLTLAAFIWVLSRIIAPNTGPPRVVEASGIPAIIRALPASAHFSYTGLAYFDGKLYAATNVGLMEVEGDRVTRLYCTQKWDSVVSGAWVDVADHLLWVMDEHTHELLSFDGGRWDRVAMPTPGKGYYSRGDVLEGVRPVGNPRGFWMASASSAWKWDTAEKHWKLENMPGLVMTAERSDDLIGVLPIGGQLLLILRHEPLAFLVKPDEDFQSDTAMIKASNWHDIPSRQPLRFFADQWVVAGDSGYICTRTGSVLRVTAQEISLVDTPDACEPLATGPGGVLLGSFRTKGVYQSNGASWKLKANHPYPSGQGEYWTHLSASGDQMALIIEAMPGSPAPKSLWVSHDDNFLPVSLP